MTTQENQFPAFEHKKVLLCIGIFLKRAQNRAGAQTPCVGHTQHGHQANTLAALPLEHCSDQNFRHPEIQIETNDLAGVLIGIRQKS